MQLRQALTAEQLQSEPRIYNSFLIVLCADGSYYIEVWGKSKLGRQHN